MTNRWLIRLLGIACLVSSFIATAQTELSQINKLKAAYLFNFTKYIEWPEDALPPTSPIQICLHAAPAFIAFMQELVEGRKVGKHLQQVRVEDLHNASTCHMTFLNRSLPEPMPQTTDSLLVVGSEEIQHPLSAVTFYLDNRKLRFEFNMARVEKLDISISSELLKLARIK